MSLVSIFGADPLPSFTNFLADLNNTFVVCIFYQHHTYVFTSINVYEAAYIASFIRDEFPKNEFTIKIFIFLEDLPACFYYKVGNGWPILFGKSL